MIIFQSITKSFGDEMIALQEISFHIKTGELVVITGPSGSGKTTLMRLLTKEYEPTDGEILFDEMPLSEIPKSQVHHHRRKIGVVFQDYKLIPDLNVWENIALSLYISGQKQAEIEQRVTDLLHLINLSAKAMLFPSQLSGGEAQRVSIARALATGPSVIFADEPTGNLDAETSASIARLLQKINKLGTTVMICTHDISVLAMLEDERHLRLEQGKLVHDSDTDQNAEQKNTTKVEKKQPAKSHSAENHHPQPHVEKSLEKSDLTKENEVARESSKKINPAKERVATQESVENLDEKQTTEKDKDEKVTKRSGFHFSFPKFKLPFGRPSKKITEEEAEENKEKDVTRDLKKDPDSKSKIDSETDDTNDADGKEPNVQVENLD